MATHQATAAFASTFTSTPAHLARVREEFTGWLESVGVVDDEVTSDLAVAFSELGSNAVAAVDGADAEIRVGAWRAGADLVFEITNPVSGHATRSSRWDLGDPLRSGGRGLVIVRALTDEVEVLEDSGDLTVRCRTRAFAT